MSGGAFWVGMLFRNCCSAPVTELLFSCSAPFPVLEECGILHEDWERHAPPWSPGVHSLCHLWPRVFIWGGGGRRFSGS